MTTRRGEPLEAEPFTAADEFEAWYAKNSHISVEVLHKWGRYGKPCDCGEDGCTGWQMAHVEKGEHRAWP